MKHFSFDNTLSEILANENAKKTLFEVIPEFNGNPMAAQAGGMTFRTITGYMGGMISEEKLAELEKKFGEVVMDT